MMKKLRVTVDGRQYDVTVELEDESVGSTSPVPPMLPAFIPAPAPVTVVPPPTPAMETPSALGTGDVPSPMAGRVAALNVQVGQSVKEGDHLLTLEAMKMNTFVMAPLAGTIQEIKVAVGSAVDEGQALMTLGSS